MSLRRFYFVTGRRSSAVHMAGKIGDSELTYCGVMMRPGWVWARHATRKGQRHVCKKCLRSPWSKRSGKRIAKPAAPRSRRVKRGRKAR